MSTFPDGFSDTNSIVQAFQNLPSPSLPTYTKAPVGEPDEKLGRRGAEILSPSETLV